MGMARIYVNCGNYDEAFDELDYLFSIEADWTVNDLQFFSWVDPLRELPRFKEMIEKYKN